MGSPTLNLDLPKLDLDFGVYYARVFQKGALMHYGPRPTFEDDSIRVEVFVLNHEGDHYGELVELEVLDFLRPIRHFKNTEALKGQIKKDVMSAQDYFTSRLD